jgi:hypothetical protein
VKHEIRASKHVASVAGRLARGEDVNKHERKAAMHQLVVCFKTGLMIYLAGPQITALFTHGIWKSLASFTPIDDIVAILLNQPIQYASKALLGADIGLLPSGFYTH